MILTKYLLLLSLWMSLAGCCLVPKEDSKINIHVTNSTDHPVSAVLTDGGFFRQEVNLGPHETKSLWVLRAFLPKDLYVRVTK